MNNFNRFFLVITISLQCCVLGVRAQFPRVCLTADKLTRKECCPVPRGFKHQCGAPRRGVCRNIKPELWNKDFAYYEAMHEHDDRVRWPTAFFNRSCHCKAKFDSFDCGKCAFGRYGKNCNMFQIQKRRNIHHLSRNDSLKYQRYLVLARRVRSPYQVTNTSLRDMRAENGTIKPKFYDINVLDFYIWSHQYSAIQAFGKSAKHPEYPNFSHQGQGFPTWHRYIVLLFERDVREMTGDYSFSIPYWEWTHSPWPECNVCVKSIAGETEPNGGVRGLFFHTWYSICFTPHICNANYSANNVYRPINFHNVFPPRPWEVNSLMRMSTYDGPPYDITPNCTFRNMLEGNDDTLTGLFSWVVHFHNAIHMFIGGTMSRATTAPNDPMFWLHHSMVDRLLEKGLRRQRFVPLDMTDREAPFGHNRNSAIVPFFPVKTQADMFRTSYEFGYDYEDVDGNGYSPDDGDEELADFSQCPKRNL